MPGQTGSCDGANVSRLQGVDELVYRGLIKLEVAKLFLDPLALLILGQRIKTFQQDLGGADAVHWGQ